MANPVKPPIYIKQDFQLLNQPTVVTTSNNPIVTKIRSNNYWKKEYKYIYDTCINGTWISENKLYPSMYDGSSYMNISNLIQDNLDDWCDIKCVGVSWSGNTYPPCNIYAFNVSETFKEVLPFISKANYNYNTGLIFDGSGATFFTIGQTVFIQQNNPDLVPELEGSHKIISIPYPNELVLDVPYNSYIIDNNLSEHKQKTINHELVIGNYCSHIQKLIDNNCFVNLFKK